MQPVDIAKEITTRRRSPYTELHWIPRFPEHAPGGPSVRQDECGEGRTWQTQVVERGDGSGFPTSRAVEPCELCS